MVEVPVGHEHGVGLFKRIPVHVRPAPPQGQAQEGIEGDGRLPLGQGQGGGGEPLELHALFFASSSSSSR